MTAADSTKQILLIEDNEKYAKTLLQAVAQHKESEFHLSWAASLTAGLQALSRGNFRAIVLDLNLPESQGLETLRRVRARHAEIPVVILTANSDEELQLRTLQEGAKEFLVKDRISSEALLQALRKAIEQEDSAKVQGQEQESIRILFARNPLPMWVFDRETLRFLSVNDAAVQTYGYSREEFLNMSITDIRPAEDVPALVQRVRNREEGMVSAGCWRHIRKNGERIVVDIVSSTLEYNGRPACLVVAIDVTQHNETQRIARLLNAALESAANAILITDREARIVWANPAFTTLTGFSAEEVIGKHTRILKSGKNSPELYGELWATILAGNVWRGEMTNKRKDGSLYVEKMTITPVRDATGEITHFVAVKQDVTARKEAEYARRRLADVLSETPDFVGTANPAGRILSINRTGRAMLGLGEETDVTCKWIKDLHPAWALKLIQENAIPAAVRDGSWSGESALLATDGREIPVLQVIAAHFSAEGELEYFSTIMHDISMLVQAQQELKASAERYRNLVDGLEAIVWEADPVKEKVLFVSQCAEAILGYPLERWYNEPEFWLNHIDPRDRARMEQFREEKARSAGTSFEAEYRMVAADGRTVWFRDRLTVQRDPRGRMIHLSGVMMDISEQMRAQEALRQTNERFQTIVETAQESIWQIDAQGLTVYVNRRMEQLLGYSSDEMIGRSFLEFTDQRLRAKGMANFERRRAGIAEGHEFEFLHKDGRRIQVRLNTTPIFDAAGEFQGAFAMVVDITEQKQAQAALVRSEAKFRALTESTTSAIFITRGSGFLYANPQTEKILCCTTEDLARSTIWEFVAPEHTELIRQRLTARLSGIQVTPRYEFKIRTRKGEERWIDVTATVVDYEGAPAILGTALDINDHKALEEQLRRTQKMEAVGQLSAGIAHDFNNILGIVIGFSDLALESLPVDSPLAGKIEQIRKAGQRGAALTRQLLAFSRKQVLHPTVVNLNAVVRDMSKSMLRLVGEHVELIERLDPALGAVRVDETQIEQVILNLVVNARDAMPDGGHLILETANVEFDTAQARRLVEMPAGRYVALMLTDSGIGMSEEIQSKIFEPFFTTKEPGKGTGLGLATVYGIVKQSGGFIWVYSEPGHGSTFKIYFPRVDAAAEIKNHMSKAAALQGTESVLVVEDDPALRNLTCEVLRSAGYKVLESKTSDEAVEMAKNLRERMHLLITDVVMPGMGGRAVAEQVRALRDGIKVLYVSGYNEDVKLCRELLDKGEEFLQKPFGREALLRKVRQLLDK
jgi:PAS domain S-box-containing protein